MKNRIFCLIIFLIGVTSGIAQNNKTFSDDFLMNTSVYSFTGEFKNKQYHFTITDKVDTSKTVSLPPLNSLDSRVFVICFQQAFQKGFSDRVKELNYQELFLQGTYLSQKVSSFFYNVTNPDPQAGFFLLKDTIPLFLSDMNIMLPKKIKFRKRREIDYDIYDTTVSVTSRIVGARLKTIASKDTVSSKQRRTEMLNSLDKKIAIERDSLGIILSIKKNIEKEFNDSISLLTSSLIDIEKKFEDENFKKNELKKRKNLANEAVSIRSQILATKDFYNKKLSLINEKINKCEYTKNSLIQTRDDVEKKDSVFFDINGSISKYRRQDRIIRKDSCYCNFYNQDIVKGHLGSIFFSPEQHRNCLMQEIKNILSSNSEELSKCDKYINYNIIYNNFTKNEPIVSSKSDKRKLYLLTISRLIDLRKHIEFLKNEKPCSKINQLSQDINLNKIYLDSTKSSIEWSKSYKSGLIKQYKIALKEIKVDKSDTLYTGTGGLLYMRNRLDLIKSGIDFFENKENKQDSIVKSNSEIIWDLWTYSGHKTDSTEEELWEILGKNKKSKKDIEKVNFLNKVNSFFANIYNSTYRLLNINDELEQNLENINQILNLQKSINKRDSINQKLVNESIKSAKTYLHYFIADTCQVEFYSGTIKNITVFGEYAGKKYILVNRHPISISSKSETEEFRSIRLYEPNGFRFWAFLNNVIDYTPILNTNSEDYTPEEGIKNFKAGETASVLNKEKATEILKGKVFTDFMGINPNNPNGLIQTEVSKKVNIYTRVFEMSQGRKKIGSLIGYNTSFSFINYYEFKILLSKIEANNRNLPTQYSDSLAYDQNNNLLSTERRKFVPTLQLLRYSFFSIKPINLNLASISMPKAKTSLCFDVGASWYLTSVSDSTVSYNSSGTPTIERKNNILNSLSWNFDITACIKPDTRYGFTLTASYIYYKLFDRYYYQAGNPDYYGKYLEKRNIYPNLFNFKLDAFYKPFKRVDGEIFFRFNSFILFNDARQNFMQAQLGTAIRFLR